MKRPDVAIRFASGRNLVLRSLGNRLADFKTEVKKAIESGEVLFFEADGAEHLIDCTKIEFIRINAG